MAELVLESGTRYNALVHRLVWNRYAKHWRPKRVKLDLAMSDAERTNHVSEKIRVLGDEWGTPEDVAEIAAGFIDPYVDGDSRVAEIGVGGGRIAALVAPRVREFHGFDISPEMLQHAQRTLGGLGNVRLTRLRKDGLPKSLDGTLDFVYSFDVLVHLDLHTIWGYMQDMKRLLRPGGRAFVHTTNLTADKGWARFSAQERFTMPGHYFVSPEIVRTLARHAGFDVVKESQPTGSNLYLDRDYLVVLEKSPADSSAAT